MIHGMLVLQDQNASIPSSKSYTNSPYQSKSRYQILTDFKVLAPIALTIYMYYKSLLKPLELNKHIKETILKIMPFNSTNENIHICSHNLSYRQIDKS